MSFEPDGNDPGVRVEEGDFFILSKWGITVKDAAFANVPVILRSLRHRVASQEFGAVLTLTPIDDDSKRYMLWAGDEFENLHAE